jgi:hypothetical protein
MIKTLRITSIVVGILAAVLLVLPAFFGVRGDAEIENFLKSAGAADKYLAAKGSRPARDESQTSPLIKQAADFHLYLDPPPPPPPRPTPDGGRITTEGKPAPPAPVTPKFNLVGTSFYSNRPELSLALIDEPGKGFNWVRQGSSVGHLTIEQIKDGAITIKDGQGTSEMTVTVNQPWRTLLKNPPPEDMPASSDASQGEQAAPLPAGAVAPSSVPPPLARRGRQGFGAKIPTPATASQKVIAQPAPVPEVAPEEPVEDVTSPAIEAQQAKIDKYFDEITASGTTKEEELDKLSELIQKLEDMKAAEIAARQQLKSTSQADADTTSDANQ